MQVFNESASMNRCFLSHTHFQQKMQPANTTAISTKSSWPNHDVRNLINLGEPDPSFRKPNTRNSSCHPSKACWIHFQENSRCLLSTMKLGYPTFLYWYDCWAENQRVGDCSSKISRLLNHTLEMWSCMHLIFYFGSLILWHVSPKTKPCEN